MVGLGSAKTGRKFADHMAFKGRVVVDSSLASYAALGFQKQPDNIKGMRVTSEASAKLSALTQGKIESTTFVSTSGAGGWRFKERVLTREVGAGLLSATQNGGVAAITKEGALKFLYCANGSWDIPTVQVVLEAL